MEYAKSVQPSQLIAERGADVVVINPGSSNLRIGLASWQTPIVVRHLIARHITHASNSTKKEKGAVGEKLFRSDVARLGEVGKEDALQTVESQLRARHSIRKRGHIGEPTKNGSIKGKELKWTLEGKNLMFVMTKVKKDEDLIPLSSIKNTIQQGHESNLTAMASQNRIQESRFRKCICGDEALKIPANEPYILRRPICRGHLNVSDQYSMQQVCDDLHAIWDWVLTEKLSLPTKSRKTVSALLVVPDTFDNREVKELFSVVLKDLQFRSAVVHQECVAATFGNGIPSACVVHLGAQITSITCVEDGVAIPNSRLVFPFGGEDIARCFLWVQRQYKAWPIHDTDPLRNPLDMLLLTHLKEELCAIAVALSRFQDDTHYAAAALSSSRHFSWYYQAHRLLSTVGIQITDLPAGTHQYIRSLLYRAYLTQITDTDGSVSI
ncbi:hypothetical protein O6H91_13G007000 [Diphasiastrum complanatum]|uniref:Uncharacterized protein n=1 Tax=Diphasiastrum complanatum TaxID=34168 RepID=A0ACC2BS37_DIPCM|nr:hypothetical protein O6H91_13G007000 [Diphasiastrum complanatum]